LRSNEAVAHSTRIGFGYDVHRMAVGRKLIIGGVTLPHPEGLEGHSDADVLLHAVADALLGAAALGDIGKHFPNTDPRFKGMSPTSWRGTGSRWGTSTRPWFWNRRRSPLMWT
jgi:hypothetical protein